jgi:hypothetical protein
MVELSYHNMALSFPTIVKAYQDEIKKWPIIPKGSLGRSVVGADGFPNKLFFGFLFSDNDRGMKFLQEGGLKERCLVSSAAATCPFGKVRAL